MSSMWRIAWSLPLLLGAATASSAQYANYAPAYASSSSVSYSIGDWRRLRQSSGYTFGDSVSASGPRVLVGAPGANGAYVFGKCTAAVPAVDFD